MSEVRVIKDRSGSGEVITVQVVSQSRWVAVWTWAAHIDGPIHEDAQQLLDALASWSGGYQALPPIGGVESGQPLDSSDPG